MRLVVACLLLLPACPPSDMGGPCPAGWTSTQDGNVCVPPSGLHDSFRQQLGTGVFGFLRETVNSPPNSVNQVTSLKAGGPVQLVAAGTPAPPASTCMLSPSPVAATTTDAQGVFGIGAPPGSYRLEACLGSIDVTVPAGDVVEQDLDLVNVKQ